VNKLMKEWTPKQIKTFRKKYSLTQKKLGKLTGVSNITVFLWEKGERTPSKTAKILLSRIEEDYKK
jgi:DNA-binding transcriptional regulator YiaG